jgi:hypothetical protein
MGSMAIRQLFTLRVSIVSLSDIENSELTIT